jgi:hypothetical protein
MKSNAALIVLNLALAGCAGWPDEGGGGFAERRATEDTRLAALKERFDGQRRSGSGPLAAGLIHETETLIVRAQRNSSAGFLDDLETDLKGINERVNAIDIKIGKGR